MSTLVVSEVKESDFVSFESEKIGPIQSPRKITGIVQKIYDQVYRGDKFKYLQILDLSGTVHGAYLKLTQEVIKDIMTPKVEKKMIKAKIRNLPRVIQYQGSDPEIFAVDENNQVIPSFKFLKSKENPNRIPSNGEAIFWDGYQAEFNVRAASCLDQTVNHTYSGLHEMNRLLKKYNKNARLTIQPTMDIPPHMLREDDDQYVQFGCMPSKNVYEMKGKVSDGRDVPFRSAGGHIHLQLDQNQKKRIPEYVKSLDAILGVASVSMFGSYDESRRREYYGLAGEYRTPKHGLEYRPLSNVWMCDPLIMYITFELARKVISLVDKDLFKHWVASEEDTISCINECNIPLANEILKQNEEMFKDILYSFSYRKDNIVNVIYNTYMSGVENLIDNPDDVSSNWDLVDHLAVYDKRIMYLESNKNFKKLLDMKF